MFDSPRITQEVCIQISVYLQKIYDLNIGAYEIEDIISKIKNGMDPSFRDLCQADNLLQKAGNYKAIAANLENAVDKLANSFLIEIRKWIRVNKLEKQVLLVLSDKGEFQLSIYGKTELHDFNQIYFSFSDSTQGDVTSLLEYEIELYDLVIGSVELTKELICILKKYDQKNHLLNKNFSEIVKNNFLRDTTSDKVS